MKTYKPKNQMVQGRMISSNPFKSRILQENIRKMWRFSQSVFILAPKLKVTATQINLGTYTNDLIANALYWSAVDLSFYLAVQLINTTSNQYNSQPAGKNNSTPKLA